MSSLLVGHTVQKVDTGGDVLAKLVLHMQIGRAHV